MRENKTAYPLPDKSPALRDVESAAIGGLTGRMAAAA